MLDLVLHADLLVQQLFILSNHLPQEVNHQLHSFGVLERMTLHGHTHVHAKARTRNVPGTDRISGSDRHAHHQRR